MEQRIVTQDDVEIVHGDLIIFKDNSPWPNSHGHLYREANGNHLLASIHRECGDQDLVVPVSEQVLGI